MRSKNKHFSSLIFQGEDSYDSVVGLDIGTSSVKLVHLKIKKGKAQLIKTEIKSTGSIKGHPISDGRIKQTVKESLEGINLKKTRIVVNINCPQTAVKIVSVPCMPDKDLQEWIKLEMGNYFPFPIKNICSDFEILDQITEQGEDKYKILIAVSPTQTVNEYKELLKEAGVKSAVYIPAPLALMKIIQALQIAEGEMTCFVDIGANYTELSLFQGSHLIVARKVPLSGYDFTKALTEEASANKGNATLTIEEAENLKKKVGVPNDNIAEGEQDACSLPVLSMFRPLFEQLADEIDRCLNYCLEHEEIKSKNLDLLIFLGGGAMLKGLSDFLLKELDMKIKETASWESLGIALNKHDELNEGFSRLAPAIGLALTEGKGVNLSSEKHKKKVTTRPFEAEVD